MTWTLFIRDNCHDCDKVIAWLDARGTKYVIDDIDHPKDTGPPKLFAAPALCHGARLLAYGLDIIAYLERTGA